MPRHRFLLRRRLEMQGYETSRLKLVGPIDRVNESVIDRGQDPDPTILRPDSSLPNSNASSMLSGV